eukprot:1890445-Pleurochrysis_carterae.AAC.2
MSQNQLSAGRFPFVYLSDLDGCARVECCKRYTTKTCCVTQHFTGDTCSMRWHRVAMFGAPAKAMTNLGLKFKVVFPTH